LKGIKEWNSKNGKILQTKSKKKKNKKKKKLA